MKTIVIFGATGYTGLCAVQTAVDKGLTVRVFVRDPSKVPDNLKDKVEIYEGNVLNYDQVLPAIKDVDAVSVVLGTRNDLSTTTDLSEGLKNILRAMDASNVEIISCCLSAFLFYEIDKVPERFKELNADHLRMLYILKMCEFKYIAVLPPHIADQPAGEYKIKDGESPGRIVSKHDLGRFLIDCLDKPEYYGKEVGITTVPKA